MVARRIDRCRSAVSQKAAGRREFRLPQMPSIKMTQMIPMQTFKVGETFENESFTL